MTSKRRTAVAPGGSDWTPRQRKTLPQSFDDWSGRGIDLDRDLAEARESYPDLIVVPGEEWREQFFGQGSATMVDGSFAGSACLQATTPPLEGRLWAHTGVVNTFPMGPLQIRICVLCTPGCLEFYQLVTDPITGNRVQCNDHVIGSSWCLGEGHTPYHEAVYDARWADALDILVSVATTFRSLAAFAFHRNRHAERLAANARQTGGGEDGTVD